MEKKKTLKQVIEDTNNYKDTCDSSVISVIDVIQLTNYLVNTAFNNVEVYINQINDLIVQNNHDSGLELYGSTFDYFDTPELHVYCRDYQDDFILNKKIDVLQVKQDTYVMSYVHDYYSGGCDKTVYSLDSMFDEKILPDVQVLLKECFDTYNCLYDIFNEKNYLIDVQVVNTDLSLDFRPSLERNYVVELDSCDDEESYDKNTYFIELRHNVSDGSMSDFYVSKQISPDEVDTDIDDDVDIDTDEIDADALLYNSYVKINDCPKGLRELLSVYRKKQVKEQLGLIQTDDDWKIVDEIPKSEFKPKTLIKK